MWNTASNRKRLANIKVKDTLNLPLQKYVALLEIHFVNLWGGPNTFLSEVLEGNILFFHFCSNGLQQYEERQH